MIGEFFLTVGLSAHDGLHLELIRKCVMLRVIEKSRLEEWRTHILARVGMEKTRWDHMSVNEFNKALSDSARSASNLSFPSEPVEDKKAGFEEMVAKARARAEKLGRPMTMKEFLTSTF